MFKEDIIKALEKHVKGDISLEVPPNQELGDFAFACFNLAKELKKGPPEIAQELAEKIKIPDIKVTATGPYVNFSIDRSKLAKIIITQIFDQKDKFGSSNSKDLTIGIDLSSPNIGKPFHFGHLRSTIIGESVGRILEFTGHKVLRLNYIGDWGTQFGALMFAYLEWGNEEELNTNPTEHLVNLYIKFHEAAADDESLKEKAREWFSKLEKGDEKAKELWGLFKTHSIEEFKRIYDLIGSKFDSFDGESFAFRLVDDAVETVRKKGVSEVDEGALIVRLEGHEMPLMLKKSDGSSTYASRDIATLLHRVHDLKVDKALYVVDHGQSLHFQQLFQVMDKLDHPKENFHHVAFGLYLSPEGGKLSTRKGKIILMKDVIDEAMSLAAKTIEEKNPKLENKSEVARLVGVGAIIFGDLANDRIKDVTFDLQRILSFEGDTGPYLMYTHARAASIIRKAKEEKLAPSKDVDTSVFNHSSEEKVINLLSKFPGIVAHAAKDYKPHIIAQYLLDLGRDFNEFYHNCPCLQENDEKLKFARLSLIEASRQVIENGLHLLCIQAPLEM